VGFSDPSDSLNFQSSYSEWLSDGLYSSEISRRGLPDTDEIWISCLGKGSADDKRWL